jgi:hypothetical protein
MKQEPTASHKEPRRAKDIAKQIYDNLKQKQDEKLIPDMMKFNRTFDEIFK